MIRAVPPFLDNGGQPIACAHRGGSVDGLENSLAAFGRAWELGYRWFETDGCPGARCVPPGSAAGSRSR